MNIDDQVVKVTADDAVKDGRGLAPIRQHRFTLNYNHADLDAAATTVADIDFDPNDEIPADAIIIDWSFNVRVAFAGPAISSAVLDVGDTSNADELTDGADLETLGYARTDRGVYTRMTVEAAYAPLGTVVVAGANADTLTAGRVEYTIYYFAPGDPDA